MQKTSDLKRTYISVAVILFNTFIFFLILNLLILGAITFHGLLNTDLASNGIEDRMQAHPNWTEEELQNLLKSTWSRPYIYEPYTQFKERPFNSKWVNVDSNGFREVKNQAPWPPTEDAFNIFVFGGSTTFGYGVADSETIASQIQEKLDYQNTSNRKISVYNFGRGFYFSSQERILFEKLISEGEIPDLVIFIDGLNDFYYSEDHQPVYTSRYESYNIAKTDYSCLLELSSHLPLGRLIHYFKGNIKKTVNTNEKIMNYSDEDTLNETINLWLKNKKLIEGISDKFGIKCLFVIQPVPTYKYNLSYHLFLSWNALDRINNHQYSIKGYEVLNKRYEELPPQENNNILWLGDIQESREELLYVDAVHYTASFSEEIADCIVETMKNKNLIYNNTIKMPFGGEK